MDKFSENLPTEQSECEAQSTLKNSPLPNLKAVERVRTQSTFKNYPYDLSSFEQVRTQSTFNNYPYHRFRTTIFQITSKLTNITLRNLLLKIICYIGTSITAEGSG